MAIHVNIGIKRTLVFPDPPLPPRLPSVMRGSQETPAQQQARQQYDAAIKKYKEAAARYEKAQEKARESARKIDKKSKDREIVQQRLEEAKQHKERLNKLKEEATKTLKKEARELQKEWFSRDYERTRRQHTPKTRAVPPPPRMPTKGGEPVDLFSGAFTSAEMDLAIPGRGLPLTITRHYNNQAYFHGSFGAKWDVWFDAHLREVASGAVYLWLGNAQGSFFVPNGSGGYDAPFDQPLQLTKSHTGFVLEEDSGTRQLFDAAGRLEALADRFGNTLEVLRHASGAVTGIKDTLGRRLAFTRDGTRITKITDWTGRTWTYTYDTRGNLIGLTMPDGQKKAFRYARGADPRMWHNLIQMRDHHDVLALENGYGDQPGIFNRVVRQRYEGVAFAFAYDYPSALTPATPANRHTVSHRCTFTDGRGIRHVHDFNPWGRLLETHLHPLPGESGAAVSTGRQRYDAQGNLASVTFPRGNRLEYTYDTGNANPLLRQRPLEVRAVPAGGGAARVTKLAYGSAPSPTAMTLPDGTVHRTQYNAHGLPVKVETPAFLREDGTTAASVTTFGYDAFGRLTHETDAEGRKTEVVYYQSGPQRGQVKELRYEGKRVAAFTYDALGRVVAERDLAGTTTAFTYDAADRLVGIRPPGAPDVDVRMTYDRHGLLIRAEVRNRDERGQVRSPEWIAEAYDYDRLGRLAEERRPLEPGVWAKTQYTYDANDNLTGVVDPEGLALAFAYDAHDRLRSHTTAPGTPEATTEQAEYDGNGNIVKTLDALGQAITVGYDGFDQPVKTTGPDGAFAETTYDALDRAVATKGFDASGTLRSHDAAVYNAAGLRTETRSRLFAPDTTPGLWRTERYAYDGLGRLRRSTNPLGSDTTLAYDAFDRRTMTKAPDGTTLWHQWNALGQRVGEVLERPAAGPGGKPRFFVHTHEYDKRGRLTATSDGLGNRITFAYDGLHRLVRTTQPDGTTSSVAYDLAGREKTITTPRTDADGKPLPPSTASLAYDRADRLTAFTDALGRITRFQHDALGRPLSLTRPDGTVPFTRRFDQGGRLLEEQDARGIRKQYRYDAQRRLVRLDVSGPAGRVEGMTRQTFGYDAYGHLTASKNDHHTLAATYDSLGRLHSETVDGRTVRYKYGANGLPETVVYPGGFTLGFVWDRHGQLRDLVARAGGQGFPGGSLPAKPLARFTPNADSLTRANGLTTTHRVDAAGRSLIEETTDANSARRLRLDTLANANGDVAFRHRHGLAAAAFRYDAEGQLVHEHEGPTVAAADLAGFLPSADRNQPRPAKTQADLDLLAKPPANPSRTARYVYDAAGNRTEVAHTRSRQTQRTAYTTDRGDRYTQAGSERFRYDAAGNLIEDATHSYHYDAFNRLVRVRERTSGTEVLKQSFDPLGRRTQVEAGGQTHRFSYDGASLITAHDGQGTLQRLVVHGPALDAPLAVFEGGTVHYLHPDGVGSVLALSDAKGAIQARFLDDAFGQPVGTFDATYQPLATAPKTPFRYHGRPSAEVGDLLDFRARLYDPTLGRFLQPDPLGLAGETHLYRFAHNNPLSYGDPFGAAPKRKGGSFWGGVGNFIGGLAYGAAMLVVEPVMQARDLAAYTFELGDLLRWWADGDKGAYVGLDFKPWSHLGQAISKGNLGPLDTLGMMAKNLVMTPVRWGAAGLRGDMFAFGQETLGMALLFRGPAGHAGNMAVRGMVRSRSTRLSQIGVGIRSWQVQRLHRKAQKILERKGYTWNKGQEPTSRYVAEGGPGVQGSYRNGLINIYESAFNVKPLFSQFRFLWKGDRPLNVAVHEMWHHYQKTAHPKWFDKWTKINKKLYGLNSIEFTTSKLSKSNRGFFDSLFPNQGSPPLPGAWNMAHKLTPPGATWQTGLLSPLLGSLISSKSSPCR